MCASCKFFREPPRRSEPLSRPADEGTSTPLLPPASPLSFAGSSFWPQQQQHPGQSGQWFWSSAQPPGFPQSSGWFIPVAHAPAAAASFAGPSSFASSSSSGGSDGLLAQVVLQTQQIARLKAELNAAKALAVAAAVESKKLDDSDSDSEEEEAAIGAPTVPGIDGVVSSPTMSYRIRQHLGESACGTMVACVDHFGHSYVAKLVPVARSQVSSGGQWRRETEQLRRLHHPNVVQLFEAFDDHGVFWLLYECTSYGLDVLLQRMVMTELDVLHAIGHIVAALDYCHVRHIVHGDLHADNVLVSYSHQQQQLVDHRGRPYVLKLADVGVAALLSPDADAVLPAAVGRAYDLPPERVGDGYVCQQSDLYQLGLLVYLMYRRQPALGPADGAPIVAVQSGAARLRAERIGTELGMVASVLLRRTPSFRYQTTRDLWDAVEPIFARPEARVPVPGELPPSRYPQLLFHTASQLAARPESERAFE